MENKRNLKKREINLTEGSIIRGLINFAIPLFLGQLLQQFYNLADAWVVGNFSSNDAFAAVSGAGSMTFMIIGLFNGIAMGGGVVISRYFGAKDEESMNQAINTNLIFAILASIVATLIGLLISPTLLVWMNTPDSVMPHAKAYFGIYFAGVSTVILYNTCMSIMRAVGDSVRPLYYLLISTLVNIVLDLLFVAGFQWGAAGAAGATVIAQALSVVLCLIRMFGGKDAIHLKISEFHMNKNTLGKIIRQGLPSGVQNTVNSIGNMVVQSCINSFGAFAMSGYGAFHKIEGLAFLPIMSMSMALPTFVSQNLGAGNVSRAKKGSFIGIVIGCVFAELMGFVMYFLSPYLIGAFVDTEEAIVYGVGHARTVAFFLFLLGFTHCAAGALRGCGKAVIPMATLLLCWCGIRIVYVMKALEVRPVFQTISWAYPITWGLSAAILLVCLLCIDWRKAKV